MVQKKKTSKKGHTTASKKGAAAAKKLKDNWTVMVYLAGDNNLGEEMVYALKSMFDVGSPNEETRVVALYDAVGATVPFDIPVREKKVKSKTMGIAAPPNGAQGLPVTQDHDLKDRQERFLERLEKFVRAGGTKVDRDFAALDDTEALLGGNPEEGAPHVAKKLDDTERKLIAEKESEETEDPELRRLRLVGKTPLEILAGFVIDSIQRYPARHYALILSGHGAGAVGDFLTSNKEVFNLSIRGLSDALKLVALSQEMENARRLAGKPMEEPWLDLLGFDSCLMSMAEVAYEVRQTVQFMVGAEGFETATGWPYDRVIALLHEKPNLAPRNFAEGIVNEHIAFYDDYTSADVSVDLSAMDLQHLHPLIDALGRGAASEKVSDYGLAPLMHSWLHDIQNRDAHDPIRDAIILAHWEAQGYKDEQYTDLSDFCNSLAQRTEAIARQADYSGHQHAAHITQACGAVQEAIAKLVFRTRFRGAAFQHSHGVSIFFPWADLKDAAGTSDLEHYGRLTFARDTHWDEFLGEYFIKTIREPRARNGKAASRGKVHDSFLNYRPWLYTGEPEDSLFVDKPIGATPGTAPAAPGGVRSSPYTVRSSPYTVRSSPYTVRSSPYTVRSSPFTVRSSPFTVRSSPFTVRSSPFTVRSSPFTVRSSPFTVRSSPFTVRSSPFTVRSSPFTVRSSPFNGRMSGLEPNKIASMKNPAVEWIELD